MSVAAAIDPGLGSPDAYAVGSFVGRRARGDPGAEPPEGPGVLGENIVYLHGRGGGGRIALLDAPWLDLLDDHKTVERASEIAVFVALFAARLRTLVACGGAMALHRPAARRRMPLTIAAVAAFGAYGMGLSAGAAVVLGAALAPTDPVLAGELGVGPPGEQEEAEPRFTDTSEAGAERRPGLPLRAARAGRGGAGPGGIAEWLAADVVCDAGGRGDPGRRGLGYRPWPPPGCASAASSRELDGWAALGAVLAIYGLAQVAGAYRASRPSRVASPSAGASATASTTRASTRAPRP